MRRTFLILQLVLFSALVFSQQKSQKFIYPAKVPATFDAVRLARIDSVFQQYVDNGTIPHAVTFVAHHGKVVHNKAFGWRSIENKIPCEKDDYFRMASQTKAITAVAVLTLFEQGKILLDQPIKKYIPEFANPQVLVSFDEKDSTYTTRPAKRDITIRHLLTHTSGYSYGNSQTRKIYDKAGVPLSPMLSNEDITLGEAVKRLAKCPLEHDPGDKFTYGMSLDVLGYLIEVVSGMPVDEYFRKNIFEPLGMNNTYFYLPDNKKDKMITLYEKNGPDIPLSFNLRANGMYQTLPYSGAKKMLSTGAGLNGTIEDYARFCQMILNGGEFNGHRILSRKTMEMMQKNEVGDLRGEIGYSLAFDYFSPQYYRSIVSEGSMRWGGWYGTDYIIDPKEDLILLFYVNLEPNNSGIDFKTLFHNLVYQALK